MIILHFNVNNDEISSGANEEETPAKHSHWGDKP